MKKALLILSAIGLGITSLPGIASANFTVPHKWTDTVANKTYVFIPGQTAGAAVTGFTSPGAPKDRVLTLNNCGWGSFTKSATSPPTNITGGSTNWAGKSSGAAVTCTKDPSPATTYTASNNGPVGTVIDDGTKIWIKGGTAAGSLTISVTTAGNITTKANACGFLRVTTSASRPMSNFSIGGTQYTLASLPSVSAPMICRKNGTTSATYVPQ